MTTILIKKKDTAGAPAAGDLTNAAGGTEIAVNTATKRVYTKDSGGTVVELGTNPSALTTNLLFSPDATYDIGASGASRPRDQYLSRDLAVGRNLTVGGTFTVTGGINFNGNVTVGDSSADTLTINSTITSNMIFTDNTYDIGAVGATRPRSGYFGTYLNTGTGLFIGVNPNTSLGSAYQYVNMSGATGLYLISSAGNARMGQNWTFNSSNVDAYGANGAASLYYQTAGEHRWYTAPSNSSGALAALPFENNMLLSRYGNLFVTNLGASSSIGATPWGTSYSSVEVKYTGNALSSSGNGIALTTNAYDSGTGSWLYGYGAAFASYMNATSNTTTWQGTVSTQGQGNPITWQNLMQLTMPATNQATLSIGNNSGLSTGRNTIDFLAGGYGSPGNQTTASNGDKLVLYSGLNRIAMGVGADYNFWSQGKSFEWWTSENSTTTVTQKMNFATRGDLLVGANDDNANFIGVRYSSVPMYMSNSFDGTSGISTISNNIWNTSDGSYSWSSFSNTGYGAAVIQLWANSSGSYITMGAASATNTNPTGSLRINKYGISSGSSGFTSTISGTSFPNVLSNQNLFVDGATNRVLALDSSSTSGSNWYGLSGVAQYADDWSSTTWQRWVNVSGTWFNTHNLLKESGLEREEYNPGFIYEVASGTTYSSGWNKITYNVSGGSRTLARDGVGYDASGRFTAPCSGWYHFAAQINFDSTNDVDGTIKFLINGSTNAYSPSSSQEGSSGTTHYGSRQLSGTMYLTEGDYVEVYCYFSGNTNQVRGSQPYAGSFSGHFVG